MNRYDITCLTCVHSFPGNNNPRLSVHEHGLKAHPELTNATNCGCSNLPVIAHYDQPTVLETTFLSTAKIGDSVRTLNPFNEPSYVQFQLIESDSDKGPDERATPYLLDASTTGLSPDSIAAENQRRKDVLELWLQAKWHYAGLQITIIHNNENQDSFRCHDDEIGNPLTLGHPSDPENHQINGRLNSWLKRLTDDYGRLVDHDGCHEPRLLPSRLSCAVCHATWHLTQDESRAESMLNHAKFHHGLTDEILKATA